MAYEVQVDHARRLIAVTGHGSGRTEDTLGLIAEHSATLRSCPGYDLLYDSSRLAIESSPAEMIRVAGALLGQRPGAFRRLAIVVPEQRMKPGADLRSAGAAVRGHGERIPRRGRRAVMAGRRFGVTGPHRADRSSTTRFLDDPSAMEET